MEKLTEIDLKHLRSCLELARESLEAGDEPFGSILVDPDNNIIAKARNRVNQLNALAHPEIELAQWAAENLSTEERKNTSMYTTGEHCPMCSAAHGWVGLGTIIYLSSAKQLSEWLKEFNASGAPIQFLPVTSIVKNVKVKGPASGKMIQEIKALHRNYNSIKN